MVGCDWGHLCGSWDSAASRFEATSSQVAETGYPPCNCRLVAEGKRTIPQGLRPELRVGTDADNLQRSGPVAVRAPLHASEFAPVLRRPLDQPHAPAVVPSRSSVVAVELGDRLVVGVPNRTTSRRRLDGLDGSRIRHQRSEVRPASGGPATPVAHRLRATMPARTEPLTGAPEAVSERASESDRPPDGPRPLRGLGSPKATGARAEGGARTGRTRQAPDLIGRRAFKRPSRPRSRGGTQAAPAPARPDRYASDDRGREVCARSSR